MDRNIRCSICGNYFSKKGIGPHMWRCHGDGVNFKPNKGNKHTAWNKGLTKETSEAVERQSKSLRRHKSELELKLDDDGKLIQKWRNKCVNALQENLKCFLTFEEYCKLVDEAGLVSSQLGFKGSGYVLARYDDKGDYTYSNCRFISQSENSKEKFKHIKVTRVICNEDKNEFDSVKDAASFYGIHADTIYSCINHGTKLKRRNLSFSRIS